MCEHCPTSGPCNICGYVPADGMTDKMWKTFFALLEAIVDDEATFLSRDKKQLVLDRAHANDASPELYEFLGWFDPNPSR